MPINVKQRMEVGDAVLKIRFFPDMEQSTLNELFINEAIETVPCCNITELQKSPPLFVFPITIPHCQLESFTGIVTDVGAELPNQNSFTDWSGACIVLVMPHT